MVECSKTTNSQIGYLCNVHNNCSTTLKTLGVYSRSHVSSYFQFDIRSRKSVYKYST